MGKPLVTVLKITIANDLKVHIFNSSGSLREDTLIME